MSASTLMPVLPSSSTKPEIDVAVVEDNDALRAALVSFLTGDGHKVLGFTSAEELDEAMPPCSPNFYLLDVNLPGEDGVSLAKRIRLRDPKVWLVLMSAQERSLLEELAQSCKADAYLSKPFEPVELLALLELASKQPRKNG